MRYPELAGLVALVRGAASGSKAATARLLSGSSFYIIGHVLDISGGLGMFY